LKTALFIGAADISDLLQYLSKVISVSGKKVLLVDGTEEKYIRYGTPLPSETLKVVEFEGFDVAVGFETLTELDGYLAEHPQYDTVILHFSGNKFLGKGDLSRFEAKYIATTSEKMSIDKTVRAIRTLFEGTSKEDPHVEFTRIAVNSVESNIAYDYLESVLSSLPIEWAEDVIELFFDEVDLTVKINNQHNGKINIRKLSRNYKRVIQELSEKLTDLQEREIKPAMKQIMRRTFAWGK
jgi:hypothetical protein